MKVFKCIADSLIRQVVTIDESQFGFVPGINTTDTILVIRQLIYTDLYYIPGNPKPKKMLIFRFVGIFEYNILLVLILFLDMCPNSYGWMPSLQMHLCLRIRSKVN